MVRGPQETGDRGQDLRSVLVRRSEAHRATPCGNLTEMVHLVRRHHENDHVADRRKILASFLVRMRFGKLFGSGCLGSLRIALVLLPQCVEQALPWSDTLTRRQKVPHRS